MADAQVLSGQARITMSLTNLNSTSLASAVYLNSQAVLELEFRSGAVYRYFGVPSETHEALLRAQSKGSYFNHYIRNCFDYVKIRPEEPTRSCEVTGSPPGIVSCLQQ
jgi:hypothetical protein